VRLGRDISVSDELIFLGSLKSIKERQGCPICRLVIESLPDSDTTIEKELFQCVLNPRFNGGEMFALFLDNGVHSTLKAWIRIECPSEVLNGHPSAAKCYRQQNIAPTIGKALTIDVKKIQSWLQVCENEHGSQCDGHELSPLNRETEDMLLIDVVDERLVKGNQDSRYVALSYVWGGWGGAKVSLGSWSSFDFSQIEGAFRSNKLRLPNVLRDAMDLTKSIGERYLWCDALCVFQDSEGQKQQQIAQMDIIYRCALFTIISLTGQHGDELLPGVREGSRKSPVIVSEATGGVIFVARAPSVAVLAETSTYESRAWTFQERLLSKRCLFMTNYQAFFCCTLQCFREDEDLLENPDQKFARLNLYSHNSGLGAMLKKFDGFNLYSNLVANYTNRSLTDPWDILDAFEGISRLLERQFSGSCIKGLPRRYFHEALLWTPQSNIKKRPVTSKTSTWIPTWSWAACIGQVGFHGPTSINTPGGEEILRKIQPVISEFVFIEWDRIQTPHLQDSFHFHAIFQGIRSSEYEPFIHDEKSEHFSNNHEFLADFIRFAFFFLFSMEEHFTYHLRLRYGEVRNLGDLQLDLDHITKFIADHAHLFKNSSFSCLPTPQEFERALRKYRSYKIDTAEITAMHLNFWPFQSSANVQEEIYIPGSCTTCRFHSHSWPFSYIPSVATLREKLQDMRIKLLLPRTRESSAHSFANFSDLGYPRARPPGRLSFWANTVPFDSYQVLGGQLFRNSFSASSYLTTRDGSIQCNVTRLSLATELGVSPGQEIQPATVVCNPAREPCGIILDNENDIISRIAGRRCYLVLLSLDEEELWHNYILIAEIMGKIAMERIAIARVLPNQVWITEATEEPRYLHLE